MKTKKVAPKNKKTGKTIHFTKRSFMAFGVISLLALSTFGLVYNNMFAGNGLKVGAYNWTPLSNSSDSVQIYACYTPIFRGYGTLRAYAKNNSANSWVWAVKNGSYANVITGTRTLGAYGQSTVHFKTDVSGVSTVAPWAGLVNTNGQGTGASRSVSGLRSC